MKMKTLSLVFMAIPLLFWVSSVSAQIADFDDEAAIMVVADASSPPAEPHHEHGMSQGEDPARGGPALHGWAGMGHDRRAMRSSLNFTKEQTAQMRDLWKKYYLDTRNMRFDLLQKRIEMHRLFTDPKANAAALMNAQKEVSSVREKLAARRAQAMIEWRGLLTPEQIEKLDLMVMGHERIGMGGGIMRGQMGMDQRRMHGQMGIQGGGMGMMRGRMGPMERYENE
jgi:Spy/CpxP family protein refolding chaperone